MNNKYTVKWTSQALGREMEKCGEIISIIPKTRVHTAFFLTE